MAGEVAAAGIKRILDRIAWQRLGLRDVHVGVGHAHERSGRDGHAADRWHGVEVEIEHLREVRRGNDWMRVVERV